MRALVEFDVRDLAAFEEQLKVWSETKAGDTIDGYRLDGGAGHGLRPALYDFAIEMEKKLRKNDHKRSWQDYPIEALVKLLHIEYNELEVALEFGIGDAGTECVDISNFAMMLRDRLLNPKKPEAPQPAPVEPKPNGPSPLKTDADHYETELHARNLDQ